MLHNDVTFFRMPRDGRETQWRTLCEHDVPESQALPDKMDEHFTALQRMLVIRAVRSDRLMQLATLFVTSVLGKRSAHKKHRVLRGMRSLKLNKIAHVDTLLTKTLDSLRL